MTPQLSQPWNSAFVTALRPIAPRLGLFFGLCAGGWLMAAPEAASAQGRLDANYEASLAGIPVGKGTWTIEIGDDVFSASAQGGSAGLLKAFSGGCGSGASQGRIVNGALVANSYVATTTTSKKSETIRLTMANGGVKDFSIDPVPPVDADRIVVTDAHRKNVLDPMTGSMIRVPGAGELLTPDACRTGTGVFDGRLRYDLKLDYKRMENVQVRARLSRPRRGLRDLFHAGRGLHPRSPCHQVARQPAQHGSRLRSRRRHPHPGSVPHDHPDAIRACDAGSDDVRDLGRAAAGGEDAVGLLVVVPAPLFDSSPEGPSQRGPRSASSPRTEPWMPSRLVSLAPQDDGRRMGIRLDSSSLLIRLRARLFLRISTEKPDLVEPSQT